MLTELATHLEEKAARLKHEGLGKLKIALTGCNTSSLLDTLEGAFGFVDQENISTALISDMKESTNEDISLSPPILSSEERGLIWAELIFSMQSIPLVVAGIPESFLPLCGPETQSCYRCQFPDCVQIFLQKVAACTHICCDHLNVALACLYCSGKESPKMQWFSASAWENHIHKHTQDGLPIFPDDLAFSHLSPETLPSTSGSTSESLPLNVILDRAKAVRQCLEEEIETSTSSKHRIKQGPIKKSEKQTDKKVTWT